MAMHDELTQVANRALFLSSLETLRKNIGTSYAYIVVMLIDLDEFKPVNDTFGHAVGDHVLKECARRIGEAAPHAQVVARLGGDEFALAYGVQKSTVDDPAGVAARAIAAISNLISSRARTRRSAPASASLSSMSANSPSTTC